MVSSKATSAYSSSQSVSQSDILQFKLKLSLFITASSSSSSSSHNKVQLLMRTVPLSISREFECEKSVT